MKLGVTFNQPEVQDLYDWGGEQLHPDLRQCLTVGHIVRVQVNYPMDCWEAIYVEITGVEGPDLIGIVLDTDRQFFEGEIIYVENGETVRFLRTCVMEVPLSWNPDLQSVAAKTGLGRTITGVLPTSVLPIQPIPNDM